MVEIKQGVIDKKKKFHLGTLVFKQKPSHYEQNFLSINGDLYL